MAAEDISTRTAAEVDTTTGMGRNSTDLSTTSNQSPTFPPTLHLHPPYLPSSRLPLLALILRLRLQQHHTL